MEQLRTKIQHQNARIINVFEKHYDTLLLFGSKIYNDRDLVEDCIQDLFLKLCENEGLILNAHNQEAYLKASLRRSILKKSNTAASYARDNFNMLEISVPSYEELLIKKQTNLEDSLNMKAALECLTNSQKTILTMRFYRAMSYDDIAEKLGIKKRTVYNQIHDSIKKLKSAYQK